jgi:hypothetical protein
LGGGLLAEKSLGGKKLGEKAGVGKLVRKKWANKIGEKKNDKSC